MREAMDRVPTEKESIRDRLTKESVRIEDRHRLIAQIERARERLNQSIDRREAYGIIYQYSVELDRLLNQYVVAGF